MDKKQENRDRKKRHGCLVVLLILVLIAALVVLGIKLMLTPGDFTESSVDVDFTPGNNQVLIEEALINQQLTKELVYDDLFVVEDISIDCTKGLVRFYMAFTLESPRSDISWLRRINSSISADITIVPAGEKYLVGIKKLKFGYIRVPVNFIIKIVRRFTQDFYSENDWFMDGTVDLNRTISKELGIQGVQQIVIREEGFLLLLNPLDSQFPFPDPSLITLLQTDLEKILTESPDFAATDLGITIQDELASLELESEKVRGYISYLEGEVLIFTPQGSFEADFGDSIGINNSIKVKRNSFCELVLPDGSLLKLEENTHVSINNLFWNEGNRNFELQMEQGSLRAKIERLTNSDSVFEIYSQGTVMGIRGTTFVMNINKGTLNVSLIEGLVVLSNDGDEVALQSGQKIACKNSRLGEVEILSSEEIAAAENAIIMVSNKGMVQSYTQDNYMGLLNRAMVIYREYEDASTKEQEYLDTWLETNQYKYQGYFEQLEDSIGLMNF